MQAINALFAAALEATYMVLDLYMWILILGAIMSWLVAFDVLNPHSRFVRMAGDIYYRLTEPLLRHIRRYVPIVGGLDLAPMALIIAIFFLQSFIRHLL